METEQLSKYYVPELGSRDENAEVVEVLIQPGDPFVPDQELILMVTDKAAFALEALDDGEVVEVYVQKGDKLPQGAALLAFRKKD